MDSFPLIPVSMLQAACIVFAGCYKIGHGKNRQKMEGKLKSDGRDAVFGHSGRR